MVRYIEPKLSVHSSCPFNKASAGLSSELRWAKGDGNPGTASASGDVCWAWGGFWHAGSIWPSVQSTHGRCLRDNLIGLHKLDRSPLSILSGRLSKRADMLQPACENVFCAMESKLL